MTLLGVLAAIVAAFLVLMLLKGLIAWRYCAICLAVSLTWVGLLIAYHTERFGDGLLLALLMGQSVTGLYYLLEKRVPRRWLVFRLPVLLSLTALFHAALTLRVHWPSVLFLLLIWTVTSWLYAYRSQPKIKRTIKRLIACCGDW